MLDGAGSMFQAGGTTLESTLTTIDASGILRVLDDRGYDAANAITDDGRIRLDGGTFTAASLTEDATGGSFVGTGTVDATVSGALDFTVLTGTLDFTASGNDFTGRIGGTPTATAAFSAGSDTFDADAQLYVANLDLDGADVTLGANVELPRRPDDSPPANSTSAATCCRCAAPPTSMAARSPTRMASSTPAAPSPSPPTRRSAIPRSTSPRR